MPEIDLSALQQATDSSWGKSSTPKTASYSVKFSFKGDGLLSAMYIAIVNFGTEKQMIETKRACAEESIRVVNEVVKVVKDKYKSLSGDTLKLTEVSTNDSVEIINFMVHSAKRTAYYRRFVLYEIG